MCVVGVCACVCVCGVCVVYACVVSAWCGECVCVSATGTIVLQVGMRRLCEHNFENNR